jgi:hypothetical protein
MAQTWNIRITRAAFILLSFFVVLCGLFVYVVHSEKPPREQKLIENFYAHRAAYEHLRDMLLADEQVLVVASWGVETTKSVVPSLPPQGEFPINRYNEYLALLRQTGGATAFRGSGEHPEVGIGIWTSGWAGNTRHVAIGWLDHEPANHVANLDDYYLTPKPRRPVFRRIEGNWYLWADW